MYLFQHIGAADQQMTLVLKKIEILVPIPKTYNSAIFFIIISFRWNVMEHFYFFDSQTDKQTDIANLYRVHVDTKLYKTN